MKQRAAVAGAFLGLVVGLGACGDDGGETVARGDVAEDECGEADASPGDVEQPAEGAGAEEAYVRAQDNTFVEETISVQAGTTVMWENMGRQDHDVLPADGCDDWGVDVDGFAPGESYQHTFEEPGSYRYYCSLHGTEEAGMIGEVIVE